MSKDENKQVYIKIGIVFIIMALVLISAFIMSNLLNGTTTISGQYPGSIKTYSLTCNSSTLDYPIFKVIDTNKKETKIIAIFNNGNMLQRVSLFYTLSYNDTKMAEYSRDNNHAAQNLSYAERELGPDTFSASYFINNGDFQFNISADSEEINQNTNKYFLLDSISSNDYTREKVEESYINQGFNCIENDLNNN